MSQRPMMTIPDAATALGLTPEQVERLLERGTLPGLRGPDGWQVPKLSVEQYLKRASRTANVPAGWSSERGGKGRSFEEQARTAQVAKQRLAGFVDATVRERPSLELDLSAMDELHIPPPKPEAPEGQ
jgi:helix-turn-helix protein